MQQHGGQGLGLAHQRGQREGCRPVVTVLYQAHEPVYGLRPLLALDGTRGLHALHANVFPSQLRCSVKRCVIAGVMGFVWLAGEYGYLDRCF